MDIKQIDAAIDWLKENTSRTPFGEINLTFITHNGKVKRIEKTIVVKEQEN